MKLPARIFTVALMLGSTLTAQDFTGRWTGAADSTDAAGTKRMEQQTIEIRIEDGKLTGNQVNRAGKAGAVLDVQQDGDKLNLYTFLTFEGGEPLRWKLELKDGKLAGTFSAQHHSPKKWIYDRIGAITLSKVAAEVPAPK